MLLMTLIYTLLYYKIKENHYSIGLCVYLVTDALFLRFWLTSRNKKGFFWIVGVSVFDFAM